MDDTASSPENADGPADLEAFTAPEGEHYGWDGPGRRHAAMDRGHAKDDRTSAAADRTALTEELDEPDRADESD